MATLYKAPTAKLGTPAYTQQLFAQAKALGLNVPSGSGVAVSGGGVSAPSTKITGTNPLSSVAKPGALEKLSGTAPFVAPKTAPGIVPQVYSSSLGGPTPSTSAGGKLDYTQPSSSFTSGPAYSPPTSSGGVPNTGVNPLSSAYNALKSAAGAFASDFKSGVNYIGNTYADVISPRQDTSRNISDRQVGLVGASTPSATTTPTVNPGAGATVATDQGGVQPNLGSTKSYQIDTKADAPTQRSQLDTAKQQEDALKQNQIQSIKSKIEELTAQRDAMIAAGQTPTQDQFGLPVNQQYNPEGQAGISSISEEIRRFEEEIANLMQDSPEYTAAKQAVEAKEAEEAQIKANLQTGLTNVAEQPIAYNFITGQQSALERRAQADLGNVYAAQIPLQQRLATEQAKKQSAIDVAKTKYGFLGDARNRAEDIYKTNYERANTLADAQSEQARKLALQAAKPKTTTQGSPSGTSPSSITQLKNALKASAFQGPEADGKYADPNLYLQNYQSWLQNGGTAEEFFRNFPPSTYINPANTWLPAEIMAFVKKEEGRTV